MSDTEQQGSKQQIKIFYQYGSLHRTIVVSGAWAGITPAGFVQLGFSNDLRPMPEMVVHDIVNDEVGPEVEKLERQGVVREVEATVLIALPVAKSLIPLIQQMIDQLEAIHKAQEEKAGGQ